MMRQGYLLIYFIAKYLWIEINNKCLEWMRTMNIYIFLSAVIEAIVVCYDKAIVGEGDGIRAQ